MKDNNNDNDAKQKSYKLLIDFLQVFVQYMQLLLSFVLKVLKNSILLNDKMTINIRYYMSKITTAKSVEIFKIILKSNSDDYR